MNILMMTNDYDPLIGGIAAHVRHLSEALARVGHRVHVVVPTPGAPEHLVTVTGNGISVHRWGYRESRAFLTRAYRVDRAAIKAADAVRMTGETFDLVHQQDVRATKHAASRISAGQQIPLVWTYHSPHMWTGGDWWNRLFLKAVRFDPDGIITVSRELKRQAERNWGKKVGYIEYIPNGVDTELFFPRDRPDDLHPDIGPDDFVVFCPSRLVPKKGVQFLAEAFKNIVRDEPELPIKALFFSESSLARHDSGCYSEVRELLGDLVGREALFIEHVSYSEMPGWYALSDLVVLPSLKEAVNLSMLEAMAMKKPVLASDVGGLAEVIDHGETGWLVPPSDPGALSEAVLHLYRNPERRNKIAENGSALAAEEYGWDRVAEETISFYRQVLT